MAQNTYPTGQFYPAGVFSDLDTMFDAILAFTNKGERSVLCADEPRSRQIGFAAETGYLAMWLIGLSDVKRSISTMSEERRSRIIELLKTTSNRIDLAKLLSQGIKP